MTPGGFAPLQKRGMAPETAQGFGQSFGAERALEFAPSKKTPARLFSWALVAAVAGALLTWLGLALWSARF